MGDFDQALAINRRVLAIREKALDANDPGLALAHNNVAFAHEQKADYPEAAAHFGRALEIWERALGQAHPDLGSALDGLARVHYYTGNYVAAEPLYLRALAIREKAFGADDPEVGTTLNNLAALYRQKGDYAKAEPLLLRDLAITEKRVGPDHASVAPTLINLAAIYRIQGELADADGLYRRALSIRERALGPAHTDVGLVLNRSGPAPCRTPDGQRDRGPRVPRAIASPFWRRPSAAIITGSPHRSPFSARSPLAGRITPPPRATTSAPSHPGEGARSGSSRGGAIARAAVGGRASAGRPAAVGEPAARAHEVRERHLAHNLPLGSERQKLGLPEGIRAGRGPRGVAARRGSRPIPQALELAFTTLLRRKGRALDATVDNVAALRVRARPQDRELFDRLATARSQLAAVTLRGPGSGDADGYRSQLRQLEDVLDRLEAEVGARSAEFRAQSLHVTLPAIRAQIPEHAALIEFAWYRPTRRNRTDARAAALRRLPPRARRRAAVGRPGRRRGDRSGGVGLAPGIA